jgi:hypothetical protein
MQIKTSRSYRAELVVLAYNLLLELSALRHPIPVLFLNVPHQTVLPGHVCSTSVVLSLDVSVCLFNSSLHCPGKVWAHTAASLCCTWTCLSTFYKYLVITWTCLSSSLLDPIDHLGANGLQFLYKYIFSCCHIGLKHRNKARNLFFCFIKETENTKHNFFFYSRIPYPPPSQS